MTKGREIWAGGINVADVWMWYGSEDLEQFDGLDDETVEANARIIASAPAMLEALDEIRSVLNNLTGWSDEMQKIEAIAMNAIASAKGE